VYGRNIGESRINSCSDQVFEFASNPSSYRRSYLRLLNYITSDYCGIKYLIQESHLIENLIKIFQTER